MKRTTLILTVSMLLTCGAAFGASVKVDDGVSAPNSDYNSVNKSITIGNDAEIGDIDSVNGAIRVGSGALVKNIESVNGSVKLRSGASVNAIESVNGAIDLSADVIVSRGVESVNGRIRTDNGVTVGEDVKTVNGGIDLSGTVVQGNVETYNGDLELNGSEVLGDLKVIKAKGWGWNRKKSKPNRIIIGADTTIHGDLYFEKPVSLTVHPSAKIGEIFGDEVERGDMR